MIKMLVAFITVFTAVYLCIEVFRLSTKREKWEMIKTASYAGIVSLIAVGILSVIVVLF